MIRFFRALRQKLLSESLLGQQASKFSKYLVYALGEIVLVVIGILIALQINNWNQDRIQNQELNILLQSIAGSIQSDVRNLAVLKTAREAIEEKSDSIFDTYILSDVNVLIEPEIAYIGYAFQNILDPVSFQPNQSAFESLNNSTFIGKIQGTDLLLLLNAYYTNAERISSTESEYNQGIRTLGQLWQTKFDYEGQNIFLRPWDYFNNVYQITPRYLEILRDGITKSIFNSANEELNTTSLYEEQILMGNRLIEMIRDSKTSFDQQTQIDMSGVLHSFTDTNYLSVLINGEVPSGFDLRYAASKPFQYHIRKIGDYVSIDYPANTYEWGAPYFWVNALNGRVNEMDFSDYSKVRMELKGAVGNEEVEITMKDKDDPPDGSEFRIKLQLTKDWRTYEFETDEFITADKQTISVPLGFVFVGSEGRAIHLRSVQFMKDR